MILVFGLFLVGGNAHAQQGDPCLNKQTQGEMNSCEAERYKNSDTELNQVYQKLITKYSAHKDFIAKLKLAEEAWVKFREADLDSLYYEKDKLGAYGSVYPMCSATYLIQLTTERTRELKQMLNPQQGDVCGFVATDEASLDPSPQRYHVSCVERKAAPRGH